MKKILPSRPLQAGFSLIELMVSLTIGLVLILFVSSLYLGSKSSTRLQDENARLQEGGRSAMNLLGRNIKQAWFGEPAGYSKEGLITHFAGRGFAACNGHFNMMANFSDVSCNPSAPGSSLHISYQAENVINTTIGAGVDCNGQAVPNDPLSGKNVVANRFYLSKPNNEANFVLYCLGNGGPVPQPVVSNVENMVLTYGIDTDNDKSADIFTTSAADALALTPASPSYPKWGFPPFKGVVSVEVCLQMVSVGVVNSEKQNYTNCNGVATKANDLKYRLILKNVFTIRNSSGTSLLAPTP